MSEAKVDGAVSAICRLLDRPFPRVLRWGVAVFLALLSVISFMWSWQSGPPRLEISQISSTSLIDYAIYRSKDFRLGLEITVVDRIGLESEPIKHAVDKLRLDVIEIKNAGPSTFDSSRDLVEPIKITISEPGRILAIGKADDVDTKASLDGCTLANNGHEVIWTCQVLRPDECFRFSVLYAGDDGDLVAAGRVMEDVSVKIKKWVRDSSVEKYKTGILFADYPSMFMSISYYVFVVCASFEIGRSRWRIKYIIVRSLCIGILSGFFSYVFGVIFPILVLSKNYVPATSLCLSVAICSIVSVFATDSLILPRISRFAGSKAKDSPRPRLQNTRGDVPV